MLKEHRNRNKKKEGSKEDGSEIVWSNNNIKGQEEKRRPNKVLNPKKERVNSSIGPISSVQQQRNEKGQKRKVRKEKKKLLFVCFLIFFILDLLFM